jgi:hypothetical protein
MQIPLNGDQYYNRLRLLAFLGDQMVACKTKSSTFESEFTRGPMDFARATFGKMQHGIVSMPPL